MELMSSGYSILSVASSHHSDILIHSDVATPSNNETQADKQTVSKRYFLQKTLEVPVGYLPCNSSGRLRSTPTTERGSRNSGYVIFQATRCV